MKAIPEKKRTKFKGRRGGMPPFVAIPHAVIDSGEFARLSSRAVKLLLYLARQYRGHNNGDLSTAVLRRNGQWRSGRTLDATIRELRDARWVVLTRQGGKGIGPSLFAITWLPVDECAGKIDYPTERTPSHLWRDDQSQRGVNPGPTVGLIEPLQEAA